jgi:hypothetical protein
MASTVASEPVTLHQSVLTWRNGRYGKTALLLSLAAILFYAIDNPEGGPSGGTFLGYSYGSFGFLLICWLGWFGIRRRRYSNKGLLLQDWLSAHVYFGLTLIIFATLHMAFRFDYNIHLLAYVLMMLVIFSGIFGVYAFLRYPALMTRNRGGDSLTVMAEHLVALDLKCQELSLGLDDEIFGMVTAATEDFGGPITWRETLFGWRTGPKSSKTGIAIDRLLASVVGQGALLPSDVKPLMDALAARWSLTQKIRRDRRFQALMLLWRAIHVPLTIALIVALVVHIFVVFYYW